MKHLIGGAMLAAMLSVGCSLETGVEGEGTEEVAGDESVGATSEGLTTGTWLTTFLAPHAPMTIPAGLQVCRSSTSPGSATAGYTDGTTCYYAYDGYGRRTTSFQRIERTGLSWVLMGQSCGGGATCLVPGVVDKMVGTAGNGICLANVSGLWRSGFYTNGACYTGNPTGTGYARTPLNLTMKALIKN